MNTRSPDSHLSRDEFIDRHLSSNLFAFFIDACGWTLGMSFFSLQTLLPFYVKELGGGDILIGLIPGLYSLGYMLPQLFVAPLTERRILQKHAVLQIAWAERIALAMLAPLTLIFARPAPQLMLVLFFLCLGANAVAMGCNMPGFSTMLTKSIPVGKRGRYWGISGSVAALIGLGGAALSAWLLKVYGMPVGFTLCFAVGAVIMMLSVLSITRIREPEALSSPQTPKFRAYLSETRGLLRRYPSFIRLIFTDWLFSLTGVAAAFYTVFAIERFGAGPLAIGQFTMTLMAAGVAGGFLWGFISDHYGNRRTLLLSAAFYLLAPLLALFAPSLTVYTLVFFLSGLAMSGFDLGLFTITLEFGGETKVATFQGARSLGAAPARALFPLLGGFLAKEMGYGVLFACAAVAAVGAVLMVSAVPDPRHHPVGFDPDHWRESDAPAEGGHKESDPVRIES